MNLRSFPEKTHITFHKTADFEGFFELKPLALGYGKTIGKALMRILLSAEGYAISAVKIAGVKDKSCSILGVEEKVSEIIRLLGKIRLALVIDEEYVVEEKISISITGKEQFCAGDIEDFSNLFKVSNPDLVICKMASSVSLEMEFTITKGKDFVPAIRNDSEEGVSDVISIDADYSPIKNLCFSIRRMQEMHSDFESLTVELSTDGTTSVSYTHLTLPTILLV